MAERMWRTQVYIESVDNSEMRVSLPGWINDFVFTVPLADLPENVKIVSASGVRLHAKVNLGAEIPADIRFLDWESR